MTEESSKTPGGNNQENKKQAETNIPKMVPESDLLAVKSSKESLEQRLKETESSWKQKHSEMADKFTAAEARARDLEEKYNQSIATAEELKSAREQLEAAQTAAKDSGNRALGYRRKLLSQTFGISEDAIAEKDMVQLDSFEEALVAVKGSQGAGNFAVGSDGAGGSARDETPLERAGRIVREAEEKRGYLQPKTKDTTKV
jgi:vacuolar-type H+-ATPase subunit I/STV1